MKTKCDLIVQKRIFRPNFHLSEQLCKQIMLIINNRSIARCAMLEQMRNYFSTCQTHVDAVDEFAKTYQPTDATRWYTKDSFVHRIINKVLRQGNLEQCYLLRLYISDLSEHLFQLKSQQLRNFTETNRYTILYRGLRQSQEHLQVLQTLVGQVILAKGFTSTTHDKQTALFYAAHLNPQSRDSQPLLVEISVDMAAPDIIAAEIGYLSQFPDEKEVLFDIGVRFKVESLECDPLHSVWYCRMTAVSNELQIASLPQHTSSYKNCLGLSIYTNEEAELERIMSDNRRRKFFPAPSNEEEDYLWKNSASIHWIADSINDQTRIFHQKAVINWYRDLNVVQFHRQCKQSWELLKSDVHGSLSNTPDAASYLNNLGLTCQRLNATDDAIALLKEALEIRNQIGSSAYFRIQSLRNLGMAYTDKGDYEEALASLKQALIIGQESLPNSHWNTAITLRNFVYFYHTKGDYRKAIEYYCQSLEAFEKMCKSRQ